MLNFLDKTTVQVILVGGVGWEGSRFIVPSILNFYFR